MIFNHNNISFVYTYTFDGLRMMADDGLEELEVGLNPVLPLGQLRGAVTALLPVQPGVGVAQGLKPPLQVLNALPHGLPLILPELSLLVCSPVVHQLDVPQHWVVPQEVTKDLLLVRLKEKRALLGSLVGGSGY